MKYPVVLHTDNGKTYGVTVPDVPGCFSSGDSMDEAMDNAKEAIFGHIEILVEDGQAVPSVRNIQDHKDNPDFEDGIWAVVDVDVTPLLGNSEKINITLPRLLIHYIDQYVATHKEYGSRSGFLAAMARKQLNLN